MNVVNPASLMLLSVPTPLVQGTEGMPDFKRASSWLLWEARHLSRLGANYEYSSQLNISDSSFQLAGRLSLAHNARVNLAHMGLSFLSGFRFLMALPAW